MVDSGERWSWGRAHFALHQIERPLWREDALAAVRRGSGGDGAGSMLARGLGRSYGDSALNHGGRVIDMTGLDRLISFDPVRGILACDAGLSLDALLRWLCRRGADTEGYWLPAVMPGTRLVTVGGAIANDVHGKNHHRFGTFGEQVLELELARTDGALLTCSRDCEPNLFAATVGGLGLTGLILSAKLQLRRVASLWLDSEDIVMADLDAFFALSDESAPDESDARESGKGWEYTVAWFDSQARGAAQGRGIFTRARHAAADPRPPPPPPPRRPGVPFVLPFSPVTPLTSRLFNELYARRLFGRPRVTRRLPLHKALFPLDGIADWNRLYGAPGFYQYQCVVPRAVARTATASLLGRIARSGQGSFLTVIKTFGARAPAGMLSFPIEGTTLALDFPNRGEGTLALLEALDEIVAGAGGRVYPAKDGRLPRAYFQRFYPQAERFRDFADPGFASDFARRVGLAGS
jgi:FAD/FMN-containing dehydrogenase